MVQRVVLFLSFLHLHLYAFDYKVAQDETGIWAYQDDFSPVIIAGIIGLAVYEGNSTRFGKTMIKSVDALVISTLVTTPMKYIFSRKRPYETDSPNEWFSGYGHNSFPSGHTSSVAAIVTPIILEYQEEQPWVWSLAALPVYQAIGRVKGHNHWQSDVVAGGAIGVLSGWYAHSRKLPLFAYVTPDTFFVGIKTKF